ncbi:hypothetical protein Tco_0836436 [Tanacetum coccineum]
MMMVVAASGGVESRVRESDGGDRIDREMGRIFGVGRKKLAGKLFRRLEVMAGGGMVAAGIHEGEREESYMSRVWILYFREFNPLSGSKSMRSPLHQSWERFVVFPHLLGLTLIHLRADPLESSPPPVSVAPTVSPFLCLDDSESDTKMPERHVSLTPHDDMLTRWRSRVLSQDVRYLLLDPTLIDQIP